MLKTHNQKAGIILLKKIICETQNAHHKSEEIFNCFLKADSFQEQCTSCSKDHERFGIMMKE